MRANVTATVVDIRSVSPRRRRYPVKVIARARELRRAGWTLDRIGELLAREFDIPTPHGSTIRTWVDETAAEKHRQSTLQSRLRINAQANPTLSPRLSAIRVDAVLAELRRRGLSIRAISHAAAVCLGEEMSLETVRERLGEMASAEGSVA